MMSYLWILLLGSLLAGSARAQEEQDVAEDTAAPEDVAPEGDATEDLAVEEDSDAADDTGLALTGDEADPTPEPEAETHEPDAPAEEGADDEETVAGSEVPEDGEAQTDAPEDGDTVEASPVADTEEADAAATEAPEADPDVQDPAAEQPASSTEEPPTKGEDETEYESTSATDPAVPDNVEEPTDPATEKPAGPVVEEEVVADVEQEVNAVAPTVKVELPALEGDLDLKDALSGGDAPDNAASPGKKSRAHAAEATGDDLPQAQEGGSSSLAGILCAVAVAVVGAVTAYITYQKKKLCFKGRQEADPEAARKADAVEAQSDPQVLSNLLNSS